MKVEDFDDGLTNVHKVYNMQRKVNLPPEAESQIKVLYRQ